MLPERLKLTPSGAELYLDEARGVAVFCDVTGGCVPLTPAESRLVEEWFAAMLAYGRSKREKDAVWTTRIQPALGFTVGEEFSAIVVEGARYLLSFDDQESLVEFVCEQFGRSAVEKTDWFEQRLEELVEERLEQVLPEAVNAEIDRRAKENER